MLYSLWIFDSVSSGYRFAGMQHRSQTFAGVANCIDDLVQQRHRSKIGGDLGRHMGLKAVSRSLTCGYVGSNGGSICAMKTTCYVLAEAVGFEPTVGFPPRSVSNRVLSASQPRLRRHHLSGGGAFDKAEKRGRRGIAVASRIRGPPQGAHCVIPCILPVPFWRHLWGGRRKGGLSACLSRTAPHCGCTVLKWRARCQTRSVTAPASRHFSRPASLPRIAVSGRDRCAGHVAGCLTCRARQTILQLRYTARQLRAACRMLGEDLKGFDPVTTAVAVTTQARQDRPIGGNAMSEPAPAT